MTRKITSFSNNDYNNVAITTLYACYYYHFRVKTNKKYDPNLTSTPYILIILTRE